MHSLGISYQKRQTHINKLSFSPDSDYSISIYLYIIEVYIKTKIDYILLTS